jgi:hypothetical protein
MLIVVLINVVQHGRKPIKRGAIMDGPVEERALHFARLVKKMLYHANHWSNANAWTNQNDE